VATREKRLATIQAAKARLEARQMQEDGAKGREPDDHEPGSGKKGRPFKRPMGEPEPSKQENFTDPESRIMKTSNEGYQQCYNAQTAVDAESQIIVATTVTESASDVNQLEPVLDALEENLGEGPEKVLADSGYASESNLKMLEEREIDGYVALGREKKLAEQAASSAKTALGRMGRKLRGKRGRTRYKARKHIVEPPFGWIKSVMGFRQFSLRGKVNNTGEWDLVCLATNLRKLSGELVWTG
jgi:IS5 family transposase